MKMIQSKNNTDIFCFVCWYMKLQLWKGKKMENGKIMKKLKPYATKQHKNYLDWNIVVCNRMKWWRRKKNCWFMQMFSCFILRHIEWCHCLWILLYILSNFKYWIERLDENIHKNLQWKMSNWMVFTCESSKLNEPFFL